MIGLITSDRGLITSDRFKQFPANLPIDESLSFKFAMHIYHLLGAFSTFDTYVRSV